MGLFHNIIALLPSGNVPVSLRRYEKDARSIPVTGDSNGTLSIGEVSSFGLSEGSLVLHDADNGCTGVPLGTHIQYLVAGTPE